MCADNEQCSKSKVEKTNTKQEQSKHGHLKITIGRVRCHGGVKILCWLAIPAMIISKYLKKCLKTQSDIRYNFYLINYLHHIINVLSGANVVTCHCTQNDKSDVIYTYQSNKSTDILVSPFRRFHDLFCFIHTSKFCTIKNILLFCRINEDR